MQGVSYTYTPATPISTPSKKPTQTKQTAIIPPIPFSRISSDSVKFGGGANGDPFSYAYQMGTTIKEIAQKNPNIDPLQVIVNTSGGAFNLYHLYKIDKTLHEIKSSVNVLRDANLKAGAEMLDSSLEAAKRGKGDVAFRDLGFAKNSFAQAIHTSTTQARKALAHEYLAQCYELDGLSNKAEEHRKKALKLLSDDFIYKKTRFSSTCYKGVEDLDTPKLALKVLGGGLFQLVTTGDSNTADKDARNADILLGRYIQKYNLDYTWPRNSCCTARIFTDEEAADDRNLKELAH